MNEEQEVQQVQKKKSTWSITIGICILLVITALLIANRQKIGVALSARSQAEIPTQTTNSNILIVYFTQAENAQTDAISSASVAVIDGIAKGNVRAIADMIQEKTNADLYSIQSEKRYSSSWGTLTDDAKNEQDENILPALANHIQNFEQYDTVFIGYPTWWYDMPQVMYTFFDEYDFSDKKIMVFRCLVWVICFKVEKYR